jgi:DNA-binding CsgD family transcriptional regulator
MNDQVGGRQSETGPLLAPELDAVARLASRAIPADEIALTLHVSRRTAYRRLAALREMLGARNAAELVALLRDGGY